MHPSRYHGRATEGLRLVCVCLMATALAPVNADDVQAIINPGTDGGLQVDPGVDGGMILNPRSDGVLQANPQRDGSLRLNPDADGGLILNPGVDGLLWTNPGADGRLVANPGRDGGLLLNPRWDGVLWANPWEDGCLTVNAGPDGRLGLVSGGDGAIVLNPGSSGGLVLNPPLDGWLSFPLVRDSLLWLNPDVDGLLSANPAISGGLVLNPLLDGCLCLRPIRYSMLHLNPGDDGLLDINSVWRGTLTLRPDPGLSPHGMGEYDGMLVLNPRADGAVPVNPLPDGRLGLNPPSDTTIVINPSIVVTVSPAYLSEDVTSAVTVTVSDRSGNPVAGATVRLTNAAISATWLAAGLTDSSGTAVVGPLTPREAEREAGGVRVWVSCALGVTNEHVIGVRPAAASFAVQEVRMVEPAEGTRLAIERGEILALRGLVRCIGTGTVTGNWEVNGVPSFSFSVAVNTTGSALVVFGREGSLADERALAARLRVGSNAIRLVTESPNRMASGYLVVDVSQPPDPGILSAALQAPTIQYPGRSGDEIFYANVEATVRTRDVRELSGEWLLDGVADATFGPVAVDASGVAQLKRTWPVLAAPKRTHRLQLRITSPKAAVSNEATLDVPGPVTTVLVVPTVGPRVTDDPVFPAGTEIWVEPAAYVYGSGGVLTPYPFGIVKITDSTRNGAQIVFPRYVDVRFTFRGFTPTGVRLSGTYRALTLRSSEGGFILHDSFERFGMDTVLVDIGGTVTPERPVWTLTASPTEATAFANTTITGRLTDSRGNKVIGTKVFASGGSCEWFTPATDSEGRFSAVLTPTSRDDVLLRASFGNSFSNTVAVKVAVPAGEVSGEVLGAELAMPVASSQGTVHYPADGTASPVGEGIPVAFRLHCEGSPEATVTWFFDGNPRSDTTSRIRDGDIVQAPANLIQVGAAATHTVRIQVTQRTPATGAAPVKSNTLVYHVGTGGQEPGPDEPEPPDDPAEVRLLSPADGSEVTEGLPEFAWVAPKHGATGYTLLLGTMVTGGQVAGPPNRTFQVGASGGVVEFPAPTSVAWERGTKYYWQVLAAAGGAASAATSDVWSFVFAAAERDLAIEDVQLLDGDTREPISPVTITDAVTGTQSEAYPAIGRAIRWRVVVANLGTTAFAPVAVSGPGPYFVNARTPAGNFINTPEGLAPGARAEVVSEPYTPSASARFANLRFDAASTNPAESAAETNKGNNTKTVSLAICSAVVMQAENPTDTWCIYGGELYGPEIEGSVTTAAGTALAAREVRVSLGSLSDTVQTDASGRFRWKPSKPPAGSLGAAVTVKFTESESGQSKNVLVSVRQLTDEDLVTVEITPKSTDGKPVTLRPGEIIRARVQYVRVSAGGVASELRPPGELAAQVSAVEEDGDIRSETWKLSEGGTFTLHTLTTVDRTVSARLTLGGRLIASQSYTADTNVYDRTEIWPSIYLSEGTFIGTNTAHPYELQMAGGRHTATMRFAYAGDNPVSALALTLVGPADMRLSLDGVGLKTAPAKTFEDVVIGGARGTAKDMVIGAAVASLFPVPGVSTATGALIPLFGQITGGTWDFLMSGSLGDTAFGVIAVPSPQFGELHELSVRTGGIYGTRKFRLSGGVLSGGWISPDSDVASNRIVVDYYGPKTLQLTGDPRIDIKPLGGTGKITVRCHQNPKVKVKFTGAQDMIGGGQGFTVVNVEPKPASGTMSDVHDKDLTLELIDEEAFEALVRDSYEGAAEAAQDSAGEIAEEFCGDLAKALDGRVKHLLERLGTRSEEEIAVHLSEGAQESLEYLRVFTQGQSGSSTYERVYSATKHFSDLWVELKSSNWITFDGEDLAGFDRATSYYRRASHTLEEIVAVSTDEDLVKIEGSDVLVTRLDAIAARLETDSLEEGVLQEEKLSVSFRTLAEVAGAAMHNGWAAVKEACVATKRELEPIIRNHPNVKVEFIETEFSPEWAKDKSEGIALAMVLHGGWSLWTTGDMQQALVDAAKAGVSEAIEEVLKTATQKWVLTPASQFLTGYLGEQAAKQCLLTNPSVGASIVFSAKTLIASAVVDLVSSALDDLLKSKVSDFEATWDFTGRPEPWELTFEVALLGDNAVRGLSPGLSISVP